ncbi:MAG: hypothetical protein DHS20C21_03040 [Gemmatimonadota bacterium]|nr:MAG: hypothetical protein DHS20C21_03040 [Gemmatimonadota bacterium]
MSSRKFTDSHKRYHRKIAYTGPNPTRKLLCKCGWHSLTDQERMKFASEPRARKSEVSS